MQRRTSSQTPPEQRGRLAGVRLGADAYAELDDRLDFLEDSLAAGRDDRRGDRTITRPAAWNR